MSDSTQLFAELKELYGVDTQCLVACEECGELIQAISKLRRNPDSITAKARIIDEVADVSIMLEQVMFLFNIDKDEIVKQREYKLNRQRERVSEEKRKKNYENR